MKAKNHPTLKNLWLDLVAVMQWVELDEQELKRIDGNHRQFQFGIWWGMELLTSSSELTHKFSGDCSQFNSSIMEILLTLAAQEKRMCA